MAKAKSPIEDLVARASKFVEKNKGRWNHDAWEKLVNDVSSTGVEMSDDTRRHLGNMLESVKHFYTEFSTAPKAKTTAKKAEPKQAGAKKKAPKKKAAKKKSTKKKATKKKAAKKKPSTKKKS